MYYHKISEVKNANKRAGHYFFTKSTMKFFNSRTLPKVYGGRYFITEERFEHDSPVRYTVRRIEEGGDITTIGRFQQFASREDAVECIVGLASTRPGAYRETFE